MAESSDKWLRRSTKNRVQIGSTAVSIIYSPVNQAYLVLWHDQVLRVFSKFSDAEKYAEEITIGPRPMQQNPRRPPKKWFRDCVRGAKHRARSTGRRARDPAAVCGALWYRKMTEAERRAAVRREHKMLENPTDFWGRYLG